MYFWQPLALIVLLSMVLMLSSGCTTTDGRNAAPPPGRFQSAAQKADFLTQQTINKKLKSIRDKNFSVLRTQMVLKGLSMNNPMFIRAFKSEMKLELWVQSSYSPQYKLFKTYNVCKKSGRLGPKIKEGDLQTPEGFYNVTQERLNPNSRFFLSFNIGYPNEYDRAHKRTGSLLMIHGNCVSEGCLAMTDKNIGEIYLIIESNFKYGHKSIPIEMYPFRMTDENMKMRSLSQWQPFWKNLKEGYDFFEQHYTPPEVSVKNGKYAFNQADYY